MADCNIPEIGKALVAGANSVMLGSLLAGTAESPGDLVFYHGKQFKTYRGMGSLGAMQTRDGSRSYSRTATSRLMFLMMKSSSPKASKAKSPIVDHGAVLHQLEGGLRQTMFYTGAKDIETLQRDGRFIESPHRG